MRLITICALGAILVAFPGVLPSAVPSSDPEVVEGVVQEDTGVPVSSARVDLRAGAGGGTVASTVTAADGSFRLRPPAGVDSDLRVQVSRLGYEVAEVAVERGASSTLIILTPTPLPLAGFQVDMDRDVCAGGEDSGAREVWERATQLHLTGLDTLGIASYTMARTDTLEVGELGVPGRDGASPGQRASAPLLRLNWNRRVEREGYAFPVRRSDRERSYDSWSYPPLEADFAPHFVSSSFGLLHTFHTEIQDEDGWLLRFCGRSRDQPHLEGVIELGADTLIHRVEWRFRTPEPDEAAGGWAGFSPGVEPGQAPPLLPSESLTWRALPGGTVLRRAQWYERWIMTEGDSVPFLPERASYRGP